MMVVLSTRLFSMEYVSSLQVYITFNGSNMVTDRPSTTVYDYYVSFPNKHPADQWLAVVPSDLVRAGVANVGLLVTKKEEEAPTRGKCYIIEPHYFHYLHAQTYPCEPSSFWVVPTFRLAHGLYGHCHPVVDCCRYVVLNCHIYG